MFKLQCLYFLAVAGSVTCYWNYPTAGPDGVIKDDDDWGGICAIGRKQSPVDLEPAAAVLGHYPQLMLLHYDDPFENVKLHNTGHSIQITIPTTQQYIMMGGGLPGTFLLYQLHFHWASEHILNGFRYALEMHLVSYEMRFNNFTEALKEKNSIAVLGVMFHIGDATHAAIKSILDSSEPIKDNVEDDTVLKRPISPSDLMPQNLDNFFRYEGSLTTPTCDEAVIWTILTESVPITVEQVDNFKTVKSEDGEYLTHNYRPVKPLNHRTLVYVNKSQPGETGASSSLTVSVAVFITALIASLRLL